MALKSTPESRKVFLDIIYDGLIAGFLEVVPCKDCNCDDLVMKQIMAMDARVKATVAFLDKLMAPSNETEKN